MAVADLVLGTQYFGTRVDEAAGFRLLDAFVEAGGVWIDTANCYAFWLSETGHGGQSEAVIGRWLAANPGMRGQVKLATKVGAERLPDGREEGLSADVIAKAVTDSLDRLGVDAVDLLWAHVEDPKTRLEETAAALRSEVQSGRAEAIGVSNHPSWKADRLRTTLAASGGPGIAAIQHRYSYLQPRPGTRPENQANRFGHLTPEMMTLAATEGWSIWAYTTLLQGAYDRADRPFTPAYEHLGNDARLAALNQVASETGHTHGQVVLAWLVGNTPSVHPILGGSTANQLESALRGVRLELSPEQRERLDTAN